MAGATLALAVAVLVIWHFVGQGEVGATDVKGDRETARADVSTRQKSFPATSETKVAIAQQPAVEEEDETVSDDSRGLTNEIPPRGQLDYAGTQLLTMALGSDEDMPPLPIDDTCDADFKESLKHEIVIQDSDDENTKALKQRIIDARAIIKEELAAGKSVRQILEEHQEESNFAANVRREVLLDVQEMRENLGDDEAKRYLVKMNLVLQQVGIRELEMPLSAEERRALAIQRRLEKDKKDQTR